MGQLHINIDELEREVSYKTSRSGGAGGQHVNKVSTKVQLLWAIADSQLFNEKQKNRLQEKLSDRMNKEGRVLIVSQSERSQIRNKQQALSKLQELIEKALTPKKKRKKTKVPRSVKEARIKAKKALGEKKQLRGKVDIPKR